MLPLCNMNSNRFPQRRVLVVDDEPLVCETVSMLLQMNGHRVGTAASGKEALNLFEPGRFDLVVTDFSMPEMTGGQYLAPLEASHLPYVIRPYHLHDFLEKVSDLLVEVKAIEAPIRQVRHEFGSMQKKKKQAARSTSMFASRESSSYTDEELAEYERQESESASTRRSRPRLNLGTPER